jgi:glycerol-3-phosphate dehydrogenase
VDDKRSGERALIRGRAVVNATGPWADRLCDLAGAGGGPHIRPTKGAHLILPRFGDTGLVLHFIDDRFGFIISRGPYSLIGTTDDDYYGLLDHGLVTRDEIGYLLQGAQRFLPGLTKEDVVDTKWGVRPTAFAYGQTEDKLNRDHRIVDHEESGAPGYWSIYGGKLATHTWMAEDLLHQLAKKWARDFKPADGYRLPGGPDKPVEEYIAEAAPSAAAKYGVEVEDVGALIRRYGTRYEQVLDLTVEDPGLRRNLCRCMRDARPVRRVLAAEVVHAVQTEIALTLADIGRRTGLDTGLCNRNRCLDGAGEVLKSLQLRAMAV